MNYFKSRHLPKHGQPLWRRMIVGVVGILLLLTFMSVGRMPVFAAIVINEVNPKPSPDDPTYEWVELYNTGPDQVSLEGWKLQNSSGDIKTYVIASGSAIPSRGFLTFDKSQTAISLFNEGDTIRLFDPSNNQVDSQGYPSTLGYNTSAGRTPDGSGGWVICAPNPPYVPTKNAANNCPPVPTNTPIPAPTITPIPVPSNTPMLLSSTAPSPTPANTNPSPIPTSAFEAAKAAQTEVLGDTTMVNPTPKPPAYDELMQSEARWSLGVAILFIGMGLGILALAAGLHHWYTHRQNA